MALITTADRDALTALYIGMYNVAPGSTALSELVAMKEAGKTNAQIAADLATKASFSANFPGYLTGQEFANKLLNNLLPSTITAAARQIAYDWAVGSLNAGQTRAEVVTAAVAFLATTTEPLAADAKAQLLNRVTVSLYYAIDKQQTADSATAIDGVGAAASTVTEAKAEIDGTVTGASFSLTAGTDALVGDSGNNTFNGVTSTLTTGDKIDGGTGTDTFNLDVSGTAPVLVLTGVEVVDLQATPNPATVNLTGSTGITDINNTSSANGATLTVTGVGNVVNTKLTGGQAATTITYTTAAVSGTADASTLTLAGTAAGATFTANGVETITINSGTSANTLTTLTDTSLTKLNITGDKDLTITNAVGGATIATVDASAATGAVTLTTGNGAGGTSLTGVVVKGGSGALTVTTGTNKDTVTLGAGNNTVNTGAGNDTITSGAGTNTITPGAGNDTLTLSGGKDTIRFDAAAGSTNADTINGFTSNTVLSVNLGTAQTTTAAAAGVFGTVQTGATSPTFASVSGGGTGTAVVYQSVAAGVATANTIAQASNIVALDGSFTDGTAAGVETALGATGTTGITVNGASRFLLVTYSVGNIAQVWSYTGDADSDTNIDAAELSLVATLNNVASGSLTSANFSTYLAAAVTGATVDNSGQTISLTGTLNTVQSTANASGQYLTAGNDTITVGVGTLPTNTATATMGLTVIDQFTTDADVLNATILADTWDAGTIISGIETINFNMLVAESGLNAAAITPGTTAFGLTGTQGFVVTNLPAAATIALNTGYTGTANATLIDETGTTDVLNVTLNGSVATSATVGANLVTTGGTVIETGTVNVAATSSIRMAGAGLFGAAADVTAVNLTGAGNLTVFGTGAAIDTLVLNGSGIAYTGTLTLRPSANNALDLSVAAAGLVTGVDVIDLSDVASTTWTSAITLAAANGSSAVTVNYAPTAAGSLGAWSIAQAGTGLSDAVTVSLGANATASGVITATSIETLTINSARASTNTLTLGNITLTDGVGTQKVTITGASTLALGTITADTVDLSGTSGTTTGLVLANTAGVSFQAGSGATTVSGSAQADVMNGGTNNDSISGLAGADVINGGNGNDTLVGGAGQDLLSGGLGSDTFGFNTIVANADSETISDFTSGAGNDVLRFDATTFTDYTAGGTVTFSAGGAGAAALTAAVDNVVVRATAANILLTTPAAGTQAVIAIATDTGDIYYDANGDFTAGSVIIGNIGSANVAGLVASNFLIV